MVEVKFSTYNWHILWGFRSIDPIVDCLSVCVCVCVCVYIYIQEVPKNVYILRMLSMYYMYTFFWHPLYIYVGVHLPCPVYAHNFRVSHIGRCSCVCTKNCTNLSGEWILNFWTRVWSLDPRHQIPNVLHVCCIESLTGSHISHLHFQIKIDFLIVHIY